MDMSKFYPSALLDDKIPPAENPPAQTQVQSQEREGTGQNMLMSLLPMLMGGGDMSSVLSSALGKSSVGGTDNAMISALTAIMKNKTSGENSYPKQQKPPEQYTEADDYIFD